MSLAPGEGLVELHEDLELPADAEKCLGFLEREAEALVGEERCGAGTVELVLLAIVEVDEVERLRRP